MAIALAGDPELLFLDEPTTGFDPSARRNAWEMVKNLASLGKTVFLTTHFMDEAQYLADRVAVIAHGRDRGGGHARHDRRARPDAGRIRSGSPGRRADAADLGTGAAATTASWRSEPRTRPGSLHDAHRVGASNTASTLETLEVTRPSLEDVYLELTGGEEEGARVSLVLRQVRYTNKAFWRNPASAFFTFAFPLMFLVIFTSLLGNGRCGRRRGTLAVRRRTTWSRWRPSG